MRGKWMRRGDKYFRDRPCRCEDDVCYPYGYSEVACYGVGLILVLVFAVILIVVAADNSRS